MAKKPKRIVSGDEARRALVAGVSKVATVVGSTLGPGGKLVCLSQPYNAPHATKDGVTVARHIVLEDEIEDQGAQLAIEVAGRCNRDAGDGTTTATILAAHMCHEGLKLAMAGMNVTQIRNGMKEACSIAAKTMARRSTEVEDKGIIYAIAKCAANQDEEIADLIARAMNEVGNHGVVMVNQGIGKSNGFEHVSGIQFERGMPAPDFANEPHRGRASYEDSIVLVYEGRYPGTKQSIVVPLEIAAKVQKPIVIMAEEFDTPALIGFAQNHAKGLVRVVPIRGPGFGERRRELLEDIAIFTGATFISKIKPMRFEDLKIGHFGKVAGVTSGQNETILVGGGGKSEAIEARKAQIQAVIDNEENSDFDREKARERMAWLTGGICQITLGAATESELLEIKDRADDALHAARAVVEEGYVIGGGVSMLHARDEIREDIRSCGTTRSSDFNLGMEVVAKAMAEPASMVIKNAGGDAAAVLASLMDPAPESKRRVWNAATGRFQQFDNGDQDEWVIVPTKVERTALENAVSIAGLVLGSDSVIVDMPEDDS